MMKIERKVWLGQIPVILLTLWAYSVYEAGRSGDISDPKTRDGMFANLRVLQGQLTNIKFRTRGPQPPKNKVVIVEVDSSSLEMYGRWPWHRDLTGYLIDQIFKFGAKTVGLDIVFSEDDPRVSPELRAVLTETKSKIRPEDFETDPILAQMVMKYSDRLVLGWMSERICNFPKYASTEECPDSAVGLDGEKPEGFDNFSFEEVVPEGAYAPRLSPLSALMSVIANTSQFSLAARAAGSIMPSVDPDGTIRRVPLFHMFRGKPYATLALAQAKLIRNEKLKLELTPSPDLKVSKISFSKSGTHVPSSPLGAGEVNFRGPAFTFQYVRAGDLLQELDPSRNPDEIIYHVSGKGAAIDEVKRDGAIAALKDAHVILGITALGLYDMRSFPFDSNVPGSEGHATLLDNLLSDDLLVEPEGAARWALLILLSLGALLIAYLTDRLEAIPALSIVIFLLAAIVYVDFFEMFAKRNLNWNTSVLYVEYFIVFFSTLSVKYILEERKKKFLRGAFSKYVAPAVVDSILKDPTKLTVGGEKKELSILFSDIRGFTSFSENMDAKQLSSFLNDYLDLMTRLVFDGGGTLDKYIGDAVMAFWGAPLDQPDHAIRSLQAAVGMQRKLKEHRQRFRDQYGVEVRIGIGINSGAVSVGNMGSNQIFEYTVIGDHVNLASRLEGITKTYGAEILTTRYTTHLIELTGVALPPHRLIDSVKVKGKKQAVELIQILADDHPEEAKTAFAQALQLYRHQHWDAAIAEFQKSDKLVTEAGLEGDATAKIMIERCEEFKKSPPSADWDGSWEMLSK